MTNQNNLEQQPGIPITDQTAEVLKILQGSTGNGSEVTRQSLEEQLLMTRDQRKGESLDYQLFPAVVALKQLRRRADEVKAELALEAKAARTAKSKAGTDALHAPSRNAKSLVLKWWDERKGSMNKEEAADAIKEGKLVSESRSTVRRWLRGA